MITTLEDLLPHLSEEMTCRELGAKVIALVPVSDRQWLAKQARQALGKNWTDATLKHWLGPSRHSDTRDEYRKKTNLNWQKKNAEHSRVRCRKWRADNSEHYSEHRSHRYFTEELVRLRTNIRAHMRRVVSYAKLDEKPEATFERWTVEEYKAAIEATWKPGMSWDNHGEWHIDHIIPLASASSWEELIELNAPSNLQALWAEENLSKGSQRLC